MRVADESDGFIIRDTHSPHDHAVGVYDDEEEDRGASDGTAGEAG